MTNYGAGHTNPYTHLDTGDEPSVAEGTEFISGESNGELGSSAEVSIDSLVSVLSTVFDPEIPVNIYDLGLIYEIRSTSEASRTSDGVADSSSSSNQEITDQEITDQEITDQEITDQEVTNQEMANQSIDWEILMTLTAPACPVAGELPQQVADAAASVEGAGRVRVRLTWSPPWTPAMMSEDARYALGM